MVAEKLCDIVSYTEDGMGEIPDWRRGDAFLESLNAFLRTERGNSSPKLKRSKASDEKLITVSDVLGEKETG